MNRIFLSILLLPLLLYHHSYCHFSRICGLDAPSVVVAEVKSQSHQYQNELIMIFIFFRLDMVEIRWNFVWLSPQHEDPRNWWWGTYCCTTTGTRRYLQYSQLPSLWVLPRLQEKMGPVETAVDLRTQSKTWKRAMVNSKSNWRQNLC
jgi:hypothetical protein